MNKEFGYSFNIQTKKEIDNIKNDINGLNSQIEDIKQNKADKTTTDNIQKQVDSLNSQIEITNNEIAQARGSNALLKDRFDSNELKLSQIENKNVEQDSRLSSIEYTNKRQDVLLDGLLNENNDKRLNINGEGNNLKLINSKEGVVDVNSIVGNTIKCTPIDLDISTPNVQQNTLWENISNVDNGDYWTITATKSGGDVNTNMSLNIWAGKIPHGLTIGNTYTLVIYDCPRTTDYSHYLFRDNTLGQNYPSFKEDRLVFTARGDGTKYGLYSISKSVATGTTVTMNFPKHWVLLEGDYTNKPIPNEYFEGMKSTFEDCLVTQEMIDAETEKAENLNKYKAELKVVGKNKFNGVMEQGNIHPDTGNDSSSTTAVRSQFIKVKPPIMFSRKEVLGYIGFRYYDKNKNYIGTLAFNGLTYNITDPNIEYIRFTSVDGVVSNNYQLEEGTVVTPYEPYKESKQTLYLDEPLYANNKLCVHNGQLGYWKNCERVIFDGSDDETVTDIGAVKNETTEFRCGRLDKQHKTINMICDKFVNSSGLWGATTEGFFGFENSKYSIDFRISNNKLSSVDANGFRKWLQVNPTTVIYELAEPIFIPILENTPQWILESSNECTLSIDSNIPSKGVSVSYSSNIPSVVTLEKVQYQQDNVSLDNAYRLTVLEIENGSVV